MRLLLDTHVALWAIADDPRLPGSVRQLIGDPANEIFVSVASIWEIAIKRAIGRGTMPVSSEDALDLFTRSGYRLLPIEAAHAKAVERLPPLHGDPFDRMLVAQAQAEPLRLVTHDRNVAAYGDTVILV